MSEEIKLTKEEVEAKDLAKKASEATKKAADEKVKRAKNAAVKKEIKEKKTELASSEYLSVTFETGARKQSIEGVPYDGKINGPVMIVFRSDLRPNEVFKNVMKLARVASRVSKFVKSK